MSEQIWQHFRDDAAFYVAVAIYGVVGFVAIAVMGSPEMFQPLIYAPRWVMYVAGVAGLSVAGLGLIALRTESPIQHLASRIRDWWTPHRTGGAILFATLTLVYGVFTSVKTTLPIRWGFPNDRWLADLDTFIHGKDPWLYLTWLNDYTWIIQIVYVNVWFFAVVAISLFATLSVRAIHLRRQFIWTYFLCFALLGNVAALAGLSAGPLFYSEVTGDPRFRELTSHLEQFAGISGSAVELKLRLWSAYISARPGEGTGISAFPSMHLSLATLFVCYTVQLSRWLGFAAIVHAVVIMAGSVHLGWHYAIDGYFSIIATTGVWLGIGSALRRFEARKSSRPPQVRRTDSGEVHI